MNQKSPLKILILCTGNSARSVLGEYLLRAKGGGRFEVHSAGSRPTGLVNPFAVRVLRDYYGIDASGARSKSWDEFKTTPFDFVITVCDNAKEACPVWPGKPILAHWGSPDPAHVEGSEEEILRAFVDVAVQIARRADLLCALPPESFTEAAVRKIGGEARLAGEDRMAR